MTPPVPLSQLANVLAANFEAVFEGLCVHRYGSPLSLERVDPAPTPTTARFCLHSTDLPGLHVDFEVRHVGGNMYDVQGTIVNGPSRAFTYSLPDSGSRFLPRAPRLAGEVAAFLLDALERQVGSDRLKNQIQDRRTPPSSDRSAPSFRFSSRP